MTYLTYAGIGSRETPEHILSIMRHIGAYLASEGWVLRSGGADGADTAFEVGVNDYIATLKFEGKVPYPASHKEIYLPWAGFNNNPSQLNPRNIPFTQQEMDLSAQLHPAWDKCSPSARLLHQRNLRQMVGCEPVVRGRMPELQDEDPPPREVAVVASKFVVCWTLRGKLTGGTAQALRIADTCSIPIVNLGTAQNAHELEALVLEVDRLQKQFKDAA